MRITQGLNQSQFLASLNTIESNLSQTQSQITSQLRFTTASQDPTAAGSVNNYNQTLAQSQQFDTNANSAQTNLSTEDNALSSVQSQLQALRTLALQANNGTQSNTDLSAIATQVNQIQNGLLALANTQNGNGEYIFGGYVAQAQPFTASATGAAYNGDTGQRSVQIAAGLTVTDGDPGSAVFGQIKTGNGTYAVTSNPANTGTALIGTTTVADASAYDGKAFSINFTSPTAYTINDANNAVVSTGTYVEGQAITYDGTQITATGTPAAGDSFAVTPSVNQSLFTTVQNLATALNSAPGSPAGVATLNNLIGNTINNIDQALDNISDVRSSVGGRLNAITTQLSVSSSQQLQLKSTISSLQSLDYASAITTLDSQNTTLSAAMQAYTLTQNLSIFNYLK
jgi:flagellar hook-associated protein 3 FlgL